MELLVAVVKVSSVGILPELSSSPMQYYYVCALILLLLLLYCFEDQMQLNRVFDCLDCKVVDRVIDVAN